MRNSILLIALILAGWHNVYSQQHISKKEIDLLNKNAKEKSLLSSDPDFKDSLCDNKWENESAVLLCQKLAFEFDKEITGKKKTKKNPFDSLFRSFKSNDSIYADLLQKPDTKRTEERARRTILLKNKCAVDTYSKLYFRLASKDDAFAARVIKKDGSKEPIIIDSNAVKVYDIRNIPDIFKSYTDRKLSAIYRPSFYKIDVSDLQEGDIIEFEFVHLNAQQDISNPEHKDFNPVYYLCNKSVPVVKQVVEVITSNDQYKIAYKSAEGKPSFTKSKKNGKRVYRWEDNYNNNSGDDNNANETANGSSFQVTYAKSTNKDFSKLNTENKSTQNVDISKLEDKVRSLWFDSKSIHSSSAAAKDIQHNINTESKNIYRSFKENGITDNTDEEYVRKAYYAIRAKTIYNAWSDYMFAKVLANLIQKKKLAYEVIVTTSNQKASIEKVSMAPQLSWLIKFGKNYFPNPYEHGNPSEFPEWLSGSSILHFEGHKKSTTEIDSLPANDTANNALLIQIHASIDSATKQNIFVDKTTEAKGFIRDAMIDDALAYTAFLETDYKAYDAAQMWQRLDDKKQFQVVSNFNSQRKKWKDEKPHMMKELLQKDYGFNVANYNSFLVIQDGRIYKKSALKYNETFSLQQMLSAEDGDIVVKLPALIGIQPQVNDEERTLTNPVNLGYPSTVKWQIGFQIPKGYKAVDVFDLGTYIDNDYATFEITVNIDAANTLMLDITRVYKTKQVDAENRSQLLEVLDAVYKFSQSKIVLRKK